MNRKSLIALCAALLCCAVVGVPASGALAARSGPAVSVRVEGLKKTLLPATTVNVPAGGSITKGGTPKGKCHAASGAGALDVATRHKWNGTWEPSYKDIEVTSILGETHTFTSPYFWEIFVNGVASPSGLCAITLHKGEQLLFAAVSQKGTAFALGEKAPKTVSAGHKLTVKVVYFDASGKARPLAGATVKAGSEKLKTGAKGTVKLSATKAGKLVLRASKSGYVRTELTVQVT